MMYSARTRLNNFEDAILGDLFHQALLCNFVCTFLGSNSIPLAEQVHILHRNPKLLPYDDVLGSTLT